MDQKTASLRDVVFVEPSGDGTDTAERSTDRGSVADRVTVEERLTVVAVATRERYGSDTDRSSETLARSITQYDEGGSVTGFAAAVDAPIPVRRTARFVLHPLSRSRRRE